MSATELHDHLADDAVERALRADAEQWRASHPAPFLDDAVRRLVAEDGALARHRAGWWRPVAAAAAVLVLFGGVVGIVAVAAGHRSQSATRVSDQPLWPSFTRDADADLWGGATIRALPAGFVGVDEPVASGVGSPQGPGPYIPPLVESSWFRSRSSASGVSITESIVLAVGGGTVTERSIPITAPRVRGHVASLTTSDAVADTSSRVMSVSWVEDGHAVGVAYTGPRSGTGPVQPLTFADLLTIARSFTGQTSASPRTPGTSLVPGSVTEGSTSLRLVRMTSLTARRTPEGGLQVGLTGGPAASPVTASRCTPFEMAVVTGATATSVTVTVAVYEPMTGPDVACITKLHPSRWVLVPLDEPLRSRTLVDGSTGKSVVLPGS